jgi:uncharacterized membrane protein YccC
VACTLIQAANLHATVEEKTMNWLAQNWLWIVLGVVVLAVLNRGTRYRRHALGHPRPDAPKIPDQAQRTAGHETGGHRHGRGSC